MARPWLDNSLHGEREFGLLDLARLIWPKRRLMLLAAFSGVFIAFLIGVFSTPIYSSAIVVKPVPTDLGDSAVSSTGGGLAGLASITGLGSVNNQSIQTNIAIMESRKFGDYFITKYDLAKYLFAGSWDEDKNTWKPPSLYSNLRRNIIQIFKDTPEVQQISEEPSAEETFRAFNKMRIISQDKDNGFLTLKMKSRSAEHAAKLANAYIYEVNEYIRAMELKNSIARMEFLSSKLKDQTVGEIRTTVTSLMERELKNTVIASVDKEFAFKIIDPAVAPELRSWPKRTFLLIIGLATGLFLGIGVAFLQHFFVTATSYHEK